ncbi:Coiled-coil domain-containing protein 47, partial [Operophtera brumata]
GTMRILILPIVLLLCSAALIQALEDNTLEDDDFAEFEQFDADDEAAAADFSEEDNVPVKSKPVYKEQFEANVETEDDMIVEDDEDSEFEHFQDPEEFEGFQDTPPRSSEQPKITISKVPIMIRPRWDAYWLEGILCCLLAAYALAYAIGRAKNTSIATNFLKLHKPLLDDNFTLVGESGSDVVANSDEHGWHREAEHCFTMWCSGRQCCEGMLLTLKLIKRQDLVHVILGAVRPSADTLLIRVELGKDDGDPFVLCVAQKKHATRLAKEMQDLSVFCPEKRAGDKHGLPASMSVLSECPEATAGVLDARACAALQQYHAHVQYIHVLALGADGGGEEVRPLLLLVFHLLDKIKRMRLSKERMRLSKEVRYYKVMLVSLALGADGGGEEEQAAVRREEKRKQEKERILAV